MPLDPFEQAERQRRRITGTYDDTSRMDVSTQQTQSTLDLTGFQPGPGNQPGGFTGRGGQTQKQELIRQRNQKMQQMRAQQAQGGPAPGQQQQQPSPEQQMTQAAQPPSPDVPPYIGAEDMQLGTPPPGQPVRSPEQQQVNQTTPQPPRPQQGGVENSPGAGQPQNPPQSPQAPQGGMAQGGQAQPQQRTQQQSQWGLWTGPEGSAAPPDMAPMSEASDRFQQLKQSTYEQAMQPVRSEMAHRGLMNSSVMGGAAAEAGLKATKQAWNQAQQINQQRQQAWRGQQATALQNRQAQQDAIMNEWQRKEQRFQNQLQSWEAQRQAKEQAAKSRRNWLWKTSQMPRRQYWQQMSTAMDALTTPYEQVPYQGQQPPQTVRGGF